MIAGLLFLALAYFVVGQAGATRNGAQTAADAAALAAAQDARDQLRDGWLDVILDPAQWDDFIEGRSYDGTAACQQAATFATKNQATLSGEGCGPLPDQEGFSVEVRTLNTVGASVVPGTEKQHATATASAVIEPRCTFEAPEPTPEPEEPSPDPTGPDPTPTPTPTPTEPSPILGLTCHGVAWEIDPEDPRLPSAADLFTVRLAD